MPRKQRFKPSRKPKPIPNEDATIERQPSAAPAHNDNVDLRDPPARGDTLSDEPDDGSPSR